MTYYHVRGTVWLCVCEQVVHLASEAFHYHANDMMKIRMRRFATEQWPESIGKRVSQDLPLKV